MNKQLEELSKPVAWFTDDYLTDKSATTYSEEMALSWRDKPWFVGNLYSQEYVSALLNQIDTDKQIKARLCNESNSLHDRLKDAQQCIAELEEKLESTDKLQDSAFRHGLQHGFSFSQTNDQSGFEKCMSAHGRRSKAEKEQSNG